MNDFIQNLKSFCFPKNNYITGHAKLYHYMVMTGKC